MAVQLLECAAIKLAGRDIAGDGEKRHRIEKRVAERDRQVRGAGAAGRERRGRLPRDAVIHIRHEAGDGLMADRNGLDVGRALIKRIDELDVAVAAQPERIRHLLADQVIDDHLGAVEHVLGHRVPRRASVFLPMPPPEKRLTYSCDYAGASVNLGTLCDHPCENCASFSGVS